jgi:hypothetical protein
MGILEEFDPKRDGWSFENFTTPDLSWDLFRRTYLAINPTDNVVESPLDVAFYQIFRECAAQGNCGGISILALALFRFGGYMGYGSPAFFYAGGADGPNRADLYEALNIMQARQFSAPGIRNFVDVVKAGQLNDGYAAFTRIQGGLVSGDYHVLSVSNGLFGDAAHTIVPYRAEMIGSHRVLHVWDPNRPYDAFGDHYDLDHNKIVITGPTSWRYDQTAGGHFLDVNGDPAGTVYDGSNNGWFFAIPTSLIRHKGRHPISAGFVLSNLSLLFVSGTGSVAQIEDDEGRRLFTDSGDHPLRSDIETAEDRRLRGVAPWPWLGGLSGDRPGELFVLEQSEGSRPLTVTVKGGGYTLQQLSADRLAELAPQDDRIAVDQIRLDGAGADLDLSIRTGAARRRFDVRYVKAERPGRWKGVRVRNALVTDDVVRVRVPASATSVAVSAEDKPREVGIEFERGRGKRLSTSTLGALRLPAGKVLIAKPGKWTTVRRSGSATEVRPAAGVPPRKAD